MEYATRKRSRTLLCRMLETHKGAAFKQDIPQPEQQPSFAVIQQHQG